MGAVQQLLRHVAPLALVGAPAGAGTSAKPVPDPACRLEEGSLAGLEAERRWGPSAFGIHPDSFDPDAYDSGIDSGSFGAGVDQDTFHRSPMDQGPLGLGASGRGACVAGLHGADGVSEVAPTDRLAVLAALRAKVQPLVGAGEAVLPIREDLQALLPWGGLKRGSTLTVDCSSLLLATVGAATAEGSWAAFVGLPDLGFAAAAEHGVVLERTVAVVAPPFDQAAVVVASLVDAVDVVVIGPGVITRSSDARRLTARARERGSVLIALGSWPEAIDVSLRVLSSSFTGLGDGHGYIQSWSANVEAVGRGAAARRRQTRIVLYTKPVHAESPEPKGVPAIDQGTVTTESLIKGAKQFKRAIAKAG